MTYIVTFTCLVNATRSQNDTTCLQYGIIPVDTVITEVYGNICRTIHAVPPSANYRFTLTAVTLKQMMDLYYMSRVVRKPVFGVSDLVRRKPACTVSEGGKKLEISDLGRREIVLSE